MNFIKENKKIFIGIGIALLAIVLCLFVYTGRQYGYQAKNAMYVSARFLGEYKIGDGEWQSYVKGKHIPADEGDVTLKGHFELYVPNTGEVIGNAMEGMVLAFYFNHIGGEVSEGGEEFRPFDAEFDITGEDMCGEMYIGYECMGADEITIKLTNPHKFGNSNAVDDFLNNLNTYGGTDFERDMLNKGSVCRIWGIALILFAFMLLGTAIFSTLIHVNGSKSLCLVGLGIFFSGIYFMFKAHGVMFFSEIIKFNTRMLVGSMMLYVLMLNVLIAFWLDGKAKKVGTGMTVLALLSVSAFMIAPNFWGIRFYDTLPIWATVQSVICLVMIVLLAHRFGVGGKNEKIISGLAMLPMSAFILDSIGTGLGLWQGGVISENVFIIIFVAALILTLKIVPENMNAAARARELEGEKLILKAELADSRIATPHTQTKCHIKQLREV